MSQAYNVIAHHFIGGVYAKEIIIEDGFEVQQHKHEFNHMSVLVEGCAIVWQGDKQVTYYAPAVIEIKAGIAHSIQSVNGRVVWLCIHKTDETDESKVDEVLIQKQPAMIDTGVTIDVSEMKSQLDNHPELWNQYPLRTQSENSPHKGCDDIWVRYNAVENLDMSNPLSLQGEHESTWYPDADDKLPEVEQILYLLIEEIEALKGAEIGGILITRIPPGGKVLRHTDAGRWHAEHYKDKYLIPIQCDEKQAFCYDNERHITEIGHVYKFNNLIDHWVDNNSDKERISLIICTRHNS